MILRCWRSDKRNLSRFLTKMDGRDHSGELSRMLVSLPFPIPTASRTTLSRDIVARRPTLATAHDVICQPDDLGHSY